MKELTVDGIMWLANGCEMVFDNILAIKNEGTGELLNSSCLKDAWRRYRLGGM